MAASVSQRRLCFFMFGFWGWYCGAVQNTMTESKTAEMWQLGILYAICIYAVFHCRVLEKSTLLKGWAVQVSMKFSGTNKALIKIACIMKDIFSAETVVCVTYIPKGMTNNPSLWSQDLLGQYWKCDLRMIQYREIIVIPYLHFRGCKPYWVNYLTAYCQPIKY